MGRLLSLAIALMAQPVAAQDLPQGCWARDYSAAHLRDNPAQNVASIRLNFLRATEETGGIPVMEVMVRLADQGLARSTGMGGAVLIQTAYCYPDGTTWTCGVECDGGQMRIKALAGDTLDVTTDYFLVGQTEGCGGVFDLAERMRATTYRVKKAAASACLGG